MIYKIHPSKILNQTRPKIRVYNESSKEGFINDLLKTNWAPVYKNEDPSLSFKIFHDTYKKLHDKHFPLQTLSRRKAKQSPWMTKELNKMRKTRDKNRILVIKGLLADEEYKKHKNKTRKMMRIAQENYFKKLFDEKQNGMKRMWRHLGTMLNPKRSKGPHMVKRLLSENVTITENLDIATLLHNRQTTGK